MILAIIILSILLTASLVFALFCYLHYHLIRKDFQAYQRIAESYKLHERFYNDVTHSIDNVVTAIENLEQTVRR